MEPFPSGITFQGIERIEGLLGQQTSAQVRSFCCLNTKKSFCLDSSKPQILAPLADLIYHQIRSLTWRLQT